jgi:hypothetical protein
MMRVVGPACVLALVVAASGCAGTAARADAVSDSTLLVRRAARLQETLARGDSTPADEAIARWDMPPGLKEISGLILTPDGRLFTHGDERADVFQIDYRRGALVKEFAVGDPAVHGDFESITLMHDTLVLFTSDGVLYRFREGTKGESVSYVKEDTGLGARCEFEGIVFDSASSSLLMACKHVHDKAMKDSLIIYRWPVGGAADTGAAAKAKAHSRAPKLSYLAVPLARIIGSNGWTTLHPSDITIDPFNGNYVIIASIEKALFEITPAGIVVFARPLPPGHEQAEGVAITRDSILIVSDEAKGGPAQITLYRWHPSL